jgi:hypothetical protein
MFHVERSTAVNPLRNIQYLIEMTEQQASLNGPQSDREMALSANGRGADIDLNGAGIN